jgi:hypothetical protein
MDQLPRYWLIEIRDGRIVRQTVWNDLSAIRRQLE